MKLVKTVGAVLVIVGLVAVGALYAPRAFGQGATVVRVPSEGPAIAQVFVSGGGHIGVSIRDVDKADVEREKLSGAWGAVIEEVRSGSPAEKAGLKAGDVVIEYDGDRVRSARQLTRLVSETPEGRTVKTAVMRAGKRMDVDITPESGSAFQFSDRLGRDFESLGRDLRLKVQPEIERLRDLYVEPPIAFEFSGRITAGRLGVSAQDLTPQLADYFGVKEGVLVSAVTADSVAGKAGLKAGDVITAIDGTTVGKVADVRRRVERLDDGEDFTIAVTRDRNALTLNGKMADPQTRARRRIVGTL
jgi:serine protease Do